MAKQEQEKERNPKYQEKEIEFKRFISLEISV